MKRLLIAAALWLSAGSAAHAFNGYWPNGFGVKSRGMGGTGVAVALDSMSGVANPAALAHVGNRFDLGLSLIHPPRDYVIGPGGLFSPHAGESDTDVLFAPELGLNRMVRDDLALGLNIYGSGVNTDYPADAGGSGTFLAGSTGVDLQQIFFGPVVAYRLADGLSIGGGPIVGLQFFEVNGLTAFAPLSTDPGALTNNGTDSSWGLGGRFGVQARLLPSLMLGVSYQTRVDMDELDDYAGLLPEDGALDAPANLTVGLAYSFGQASFVALDVQRIFYSDAALWGDSIANLLAGCAAAGGSGTAGCLGGAAGPGVGWDDITVLKIGGQWEFLPGWIGRAGFSHTTTPVRGREIAFNILTPATIENDLTLGLTRTLGESNEVSLHVRYGFENSVSGTAPAAIGGHPITVSNRQLEFGLSWGFRF